MRITVIIFLLIIARASFAQDEFYRNIDWKFIPDSVVVVAQDTYSVRAVPYDYNDPSAIQREIGNYVVDFVGHRYKVIDYTTTTLVVFDEYSTGQAPQTGQIARCYQSVNGGEYPYVGSVDYSPLDMSARWRLNGADNELMYRHGIEYDYPFKRLVLDTTYSPDGTEPTSTSYWDEPNGTFSDVLKDGVVGQRYKELFKSGQNDTGADILNGTPVEYAGSIGNSGNFRIQEALIEVDKPTYFFIGIATQDIPNGEVGNITTHGKVRGIQTNGANYGEVWTDSTIIYPSHITRGYLTKTPPPAPYAAIPVALVISAHPTNGTLEVNPSYPMTLGELIDVDGSNPTTTGDLLTFDQVNGVWDRGIYTISNDVYSSDWFGKDTIVPTFDNLYNKLSQFETVNYCCDSAVVNFGSIFSGSQDSLCVMDGKHLTIAEAAPNPPFQVDFVFQNVERLQYFSFFGNYDGSPSHNVHVFAYDYTTLQWDFIGEFSTSEADRWYSWPIFMPNDHINNGEVKIRVEHQGNGIISHRMYFDYVEVNFGGTGGGNFITAGSVDFMPYNLLTSTNVQGAVQQFYDLWEDTTNVLRGDISALQAESHPAATITGTPDYITINPTTQVITRNQIDLTTDVTGILPDANVANNITLDNITQITNRSHSNMSGLDYASSGHTGFEPTLTKGNLTETVTGLQFSATRQVIGGSATLGLTTGYFIPTTLEKANWDDAYSYSQIGHLPLTGGSMLNTNKVINMNADLLDNLNVGDGVWSTSFIPRVRTDGVAELGKIIDFHADNAATYDYDARIIVSSGGGIGLGTLSISGNLSAINFSGSSSGVNTGDRSSSDFTHNDLSGLNDGTTFQHITTTQETNFETAYSFTNDASLLPDNYLTYMSGGLLNESLIYQTGGNILINKISDSGGVLQVYKINDEGIKITDTKAFSSIDLGKVISNNFFAVDQLRSASVSGFYLTNYNSDDVILQAAKNDASAGNEILLNPFGGDIAIGKTAASYKLDVNGAGGFSGAVTIAADPYDSSWDGLQEAATKDAVYDQFQTLNVSNWDASYNHSLLTTGNPHNVLATQISDFDTEVGNNTTVQTALNLDLQDVTDNGASTDNPIRIITNSNISDISYGVGGFLSSGNSVFFRMEV